MYGCLNHWNVLFCQGLGRGKSMTLCIVVPDPQLVSIGDSRPGWGLSLVKCQDKSTRASRGTASPLCSALSHMMPLPFCRRSASATWTMKLGEAWSWVATWYSELSHLHGSEISITTWEVFQRLFILNPVSCSVMLPKPFVRGFKVHAEWGVQSDRAEV